MTDSFQTFGFGQDDKGFGVRSKKFKGEKGKTYRLGFAWWDGFDKDNFGVDNLTLKEGDDERSLTPKFIGAARNFASIPGGGGLYVVNKGPEFTKLIGEQPKTVVATIIVSWPLGDNGQPTKDSLLKELPQVLPWVFSQEKYVKLKKMHQSGYPMYDWDIQADCEDSTYQKFTFLPAKNSIFKEMLKANSSRSKEVVSFIMNQVRTIAPTLGGEIGADLSLEKLKEKLGMDSGGIVGNSVAGDQEVDNLLGSMLGE